MDTNLLALGGTSLGIAVALGSIVGAFFYVKTKARDAKALGSSEISSQAITDLQATVGALKIQNDLQAGQILEVTSDRKLLSKKVDELTGKVDTLSTIPLEKIEKHMADTNRILQTVLPLISMPSTEHTVVETTTIKK